MLALDQSPRDRRWQLPILLPALIAGGLVAAITLQSVRATQLHRQGVEAALRDYAAFTTWQYARRTSDYTRLTIVTMLSDGAGRRPSARGDIRGGRATVTANHTALSTEIVQRAMEYAVLRASRSETRIGLLPAGDSHDGRFLGYWLRSDSAGSATRIDAVVIERDELIRIVRHTASFAPLLPSGVVGTQHTDSLIGIQLVASDGRTIASVGGRFTGLSTSDTLGPDLAGLRVITTLHPTAVGRLIPGGIPVSNTPALVAMLVVTVVMCCIAGLQLRRSHELARARGDFVASVSHELKTPLAQISLFAETLASPRERSETERRRYLTIIAREAKRLGQLVDSILHFASMTRGDAAGLEREPVLLGDELRETVAAFRPIASARGVTVLARIDDEIDIQLDRDAFRQLMLNVLDNALKFGPENGVIRVAAAFREDTTIIHVDDDGPGVPVREREHVFQAFTRADRGAHRAGSGIGLAVVKDVVDRHGGTVRMRASPSGGARVEIELPGGALARIDERARAATYP